MSDETIVYTSLRSSKKELLPVRRIVFRDEALNKEFVFVSNRFDWPASLIAQIYKQRWQVELFFKWIKQNLKLKSFVGRFRQCRDDANYGGDVFISVGCLFEVHFKIQAVTATNHSIDSSQCFYQAVSKSTV